ncbi:MAG: YceI family protein [Pseudoxanthomonas suwonensis]|nr:YceI family protein [Pseudoxanthomonas suwonensis]
MTSSIATRLLPLALAVSLAACAQGDAPVVDAASQAPATTETVAADTAPAARPAAEPITLQSGTYVMDPSHTIVLAQWNHLGFSNPSANFADANGSIVIDAEDMSRSSVQVSFPLDSAIRSFSADFDAHLRNADFFDVGRFPEARFASTAVESLGGNKYKVTGDLTIKDNTAPVVLDVTLNGSGPHPMTQAQSIGFDATARILRSDFGVGMVAPMVSDEVDLRITTEASVQGEAPATDEAS